MNVQSFSQRLRNEEYDLTEGLITQPPDTLEAYREVVGQIRGLRKALDILGEVLDEDK